MSATAGIIYEFGPFRLDSARRLLTRQDRPIALPPKTFDLLVLLVESQGRVFTKKELIGALWPDTFVEDANLTFQISALRKALGTEGSEWIETLPRYGYRFSGNVSGLDQAQTPPVTPAATSENGSRSLSEAAAASQANRHRPAYLWAALGLLAMANAGYLGFTHWRESRSEERAITFQISPPDRVTTPDTDSIALSPVGDKLAFIGVGPDGSRKLWIRALESLKAEPVPGTELVDSAFWSPDGRSVAFFASGKLKKMDLQGGLPQAICDTPIARSHGTWSRNNIILFETLDRPEIYSVSAAGGTPKPATRPSSSNFELRHSAPQFLPDGHHFIYFVQSSRAENTGIYVASLDAPGARRLTVSSANGVYARLAGSGSHILFARGTNLTAQAFDARKLELTGAPFVVSQNLLVGIGGGVPRAAISASEDGVIAYRTRMDSGSTELTWYDRSGKRLETIGDSADYSNLDLSPDGKRLIVSRMDPQVRTRDLWLFDLSNGASSRVTFDPADETNPVWSPDGTRVAFNMVHNGVVDIYEKEIAGASSPRVLLHSGDNKYIHGWSPDGKLLLYRIGPITWALPRDGGVSLGPFEMENPRISPNGKWVVYTSNQSGRSEVYVQNFPPGEGKWQISTAGGSEPSWRADGKELYYLSADKLMAVQVKADSPVFEPSAAKPLFEIHVESIARRSRYQSAPNGKRFVINRPIESSPAVTITINWMTKPAR